MGRILLRDTAITAPLPDPRTGPATFVLNGGAGAGQCRVVAAPAPGLWRALRRNGTNRGYRWHGPDPSAPGIRRIVLKPGAIEIRARGADWPCTVTAPQRLPVAVAVRVAGTRWCAAFDAPAVDNRAGRVKIAASPPPATCDDVKDDLTVVTQNVLHGLACPAGTANCRLADRIDLLFQWIAASGCPDAVTLQEVSDAALPLITAHLTTTCPFPYAMAYVRTFGVDDEAILSRYPFDVTDSIRLLGNFRHVTFARVHHPLGPVDIFASHLASGSDGAQSPCAASCPAECVGAGAATLRQCQAAQYANLVAARHDVPTPAVATGDFNESPDTFVYAQFAGRGWIDSHRAAGNPECDPLSGAQCTSGRDDTSLAQLESPALNENERIDYVFVIPSSVRPCRIEAAGDPDGDGVASGLFAGRPNPFVDACGPAPEAICWPSDHIGAGVDLGCT